MLLFYIAKWIALQILFYFDMETRDIDNETKKDIIFFYFKNKLKTLIKHHLIILTG